MSARGATKNRKAGAAGRSGEGVRSDLEARVELRGRGGIDLELRSKVEPYFGDAIREQVAGVLAALGVEHACVEIDDRGALPFVIAARVEAAARRAGADGESVALPDACGAPAPASTRDRPRRSRLYLPGGEPKYMINAGLFRPDGIILDLEDSVHADDKDAARLLVRNALVSVDFGGAERMVRINPLPLGLADLESVVPCGPDLILLPKVESDEQVTAAAREIDRILGDRGDERPLWLMPIVETALGIENSFAIAGASDRVAAVTLGLEDYAADLGVPKTPAGDESDYARRRMANAARAAGVQAIDSVYGQVDDLDGLRAWARRSRGLGYQGMGCLHPRQIAVIHEAYNPTPAEIERALRIEAAYERARAEGRAVVSLGSKMIDPPVVAQSRRLLELARTLGLVDEGTESEP